MHATLATPVSGRCVQVPASAQESAVQGSPSSQRAGSEGVQAWPGTVVLVVVVVA
jgi:hypothetical protein